MAELSTDFKKLLAGINKDDDLRIGSMNMVADDVEVITVGNMAIDHIIGVGGLPRGRSIELFGPPSSGKTTTALQVAAQAQRDGHNILYLDYEQAMDKVYAKALGLDCDAESFLFGQPSSFEQGMNAARTLIGTGELGIVIWDSVASMVTEAQLEAEAGKSVPMIQARLMSEELRKLNPLLKQTKTMAIFLNHVMEKVNFSRPGAPPTTTTPGGRALKYYASVRIEYQQIGNQINKEKDALSGEDTTMVRSTTVRVKVVKNKVGPPFQQCLVRVQYGQGFSNVWSALQVLLGHKVVVKSSGYYYFSPAESAADLVHEEMGTSKTGRRYVLGEENLLKFAEANPVWKELFIAKARAIVDTLGTGGLVELGTPEEDSDETVDPVSQTDELQESSNTDGDGAGASFPIPSDSAGVGPSSRAPGVLSTADLLGGDDEDLLVPAT